MARHFEYGAGDWEEITPLERKKNHELASFIFKPPLINRVQRVFLWPLDKVHAVLVEYLRFLLLKEELEDYDANVLLAPPILARVWECHIVDTVDYRTCLEKAMGPGVFYDNNPEMLSNMEDVIKEEKISQLHLFYHGKFGHDPDPFFWSFDPSAIAFVGGAAFQPPVPPQAPPRYPRGVVEDHPPPNMALRRAINPNALYPAGSGRFPRDLSGTMRTGRHDRFPRTMPASPGGRPLNDRWNEDDDDARSDASKDNGAAGDSAPSAPKAPYLPNLKNFIGNYHESQPEGNRKNAGTVVGARGAEEGASNAGGGTARERGAQRMQLCDDDSADPGPSDNTTYASAAKSALLERAPSNKLISLIIKCKEPRLRHVITDWPVSSSVAHLKQHIYELSLETISPHFALAILGKRIDADESKSLDDVVAGAMDGDIFTIEPIKE